LILEFRLHSLIPRFRNLDLEYLQHLHARGIIVCVEHITFQKDLYLGDIKDAWVCLCGNSPDYTGFFPCDKDGNEMVPDVASNWDDLYVCARCGRIIKQSTLEVVGHNPHPKFLH
jgi:hypothetical protein